MFRSSLIVILLAASFVASIFGQRVEITAREFYEATKSSNEAVRYPVRSKTIQEWFSNSGMLLRTVTTECESTSASEFRKTISELEHGREVVLSVTIEHGDFIYTKVGSEPWQKEKWYFKHPLTESYIASLNGNMYWKETRFIDSIKATVFISKHVLQRSEASEKFAREEESYFDGRRLLKQVRTDRTLDSSNLIQRITSMATEYDPKIKIEPPIK